MDRHLISFSSPMLPSSLIMNFGTINRLIPFVPGGASGVLASTK